MKTTLCAHSLRPRTHGNVFLRFCIISSNELVVLDSLENSKQYKNAGKRFRVYGALVVLLDINEVVNRFNITVIYDTLI